MKIERKERKLKFIAEEDIIETNISDLRDIMLMEAKGKDQDSIVLDISNINYLDSCGISLIVGLGKTCQQEKVDFRIDVKSPDIIRLLNAVHIDKVFDVQEV